MKDLNFFEPYLDRKEISSYNNLALYIAASIAVLSLIIYPIINSIRINSLKKSILVIKTNLESSGIYERLDIVEQKRENIVEMEVRLSLLENVDEVVSKRDTINDLLLNKITSKVPKDVFFDSISLSSSQIQVQGIATSNLAIAHLENNLRSDEDFIDVYIPNISLNEGLYSFFVTFAIKDEKQDDVEEGDLEQNDIGQQGVKKDGIK